MIFASYPFLLVFLPVIWAVFVSLKWIFLYRSTEQAAPRIPPDLANQILVLWLLLGSFAFYADWRFDHLFLLLAVIGINAALAHLTFKYRMRGLLITGVLGNLGLLFFFKYQPLAAGDAERAVLLAGMPLGISFYVFQVVAYQIDQWRSRAEPANFLRFALFLSFFPQLIAGPIVHGRQLLPQLKNLLARRLHISLGLAMLALGLAKKVLVADTLAPGVDAIYAGQFEWSAVVSMAAAVGYGTQLYFDFSGYADMAVGLALLFGLKLPQNFRNPYSALNISDFWRRWHITLSTFLRDYLYIAMGGNRYGLPRQLVALVVTMALGGIWHGGGWQFLFWGLGHGLLLAAWHLIRRLTPGLMSHMPRMAARLVTLIVVMLLWIPFRASSLSDASDIFFGLAVWRDAKVYELVQLPAHVAGLSTATAAPIVTLVLAALALLLLQGRATAWQWALSASVSMRAACASLLGLAVLKALADRPEQPFLYFQF